MIFAATMICKGYSQLNEDMELFKLAMSFILTTSIPQIYYGIEIAMKSTGDHELRKDFPGGWTGDKINAFTERD